MPDLYGHLTPQGVLNGSLQTIVYADNYNDLINKPSINSVELQGNKTASDLGLATPSDITVTSVNDQTGDVILSGSDIDYSVGMSLNAKIDDLEAQIQGSGVQSVNGMTGNVTLTSNDINYSTGVTIKNKIDAVEGEIPVVSYPVTSVNTKTGDVVLDGDDIAYAEGVTVNAQIGTNATAIGDLSQLTTSVKSSLVGAVNAVNANKPTNTNANPMFKRLVCSNISVTISANGSKAIIGNDVNLSPAGYSPVAVCALYTNLSNSCVFTSFDAKYTSGLGTFCNIKNLTSSSVTGMCNFTILFARNDVFTQS